MKISRAVIPILCTLILYGKDLTEKTSHNSFNRMFRLLEIITLSQDKELIGNVRECQLEDGNYIWVLDSKSCKIRKYDKKGDHIFSFGRKGEGPGEFFYPFSFNVDKEKVYVVDPMRRLLIVFTKNGEFVKSFKVIDGRQIGKLKGNDKIVISAALKAGEKGFCLHIYNERGELTRSFFPIADIVLKNHLLCDWVYFDLDNEGNIYAIQEMEYKIHKYSPKGDLIKTFSKINRYYIPPPSEPFKEFYIKSSLEKWLRSWTHIAGIRVLNNFLLINLHNIDKDEYILDIYDLNGNFIEGGIKTNNRLISVDKSGNAYFLQEEEKGNKIIFRILKMSMNISI